jgi:hypothetical protein
MQTFLPYADFNLTASVLDYRRLGKQRVEVLQIARTLLSMSHGWVNHPAVKQWYGYELLLIEYGQTMCREWKNRGYVDNLWERLESMKPGLKQTAYPWWLGHEQYHASHRSNLLRKNFLFYQKYCWQEPPNIAYYWPVNH